MFKNTDDKGKISPETWSMKKVSNENSGSEIHNYWISNSTEGFDRLDRTNKQIQ